VADSVRGTNRDLQQAVHAGRFREDLLARLNLWTYPLPGLAERREDIEPNLDFELERWSREQHERVRFNAEARSRYRELFAVSRTQRASTNDADRLRKYLARFGLDWEQVRAVSRGGVAP